MKLRRIELANFRQHAETAITFPDGITGLIGPNEVGKSSLLEAVAWALFGARATRGTKGSIRWNRAPARHTAGVELEFEVGGKVYTIQRGESDARVFEGASSTPIASGTSAVDAFVPQLIGMGLQEFEATFLCRQRDLGRIAAMGPTERRMFFLEVLGVGEIDEGLSRCRTRKNELSRDHAGIAAGLGEREPLEQELTGAEAETGESTAAVAVATAAADRAQAAIAPAEELLASHEETRRRSEGFGGQARVLTRDIETADGEIGRLQARVDQAGGATRVSEADIAELCNEVELAEAEAADAEAALEGARARFREAREARERERVQRQAAGQAQKDRAAAIATKLTPIRQRGADSPCPTCTRTMGEHLNTVVRLLEEEAASARELAAEHDHAASGLGEPSDREMELEAEGAALAERAAGCAAAVKCLQDLLAGLRKQDESALALQSLRADLDSWQSRRDQARGDLARVQQQIDELAFDEEKYDEARQALESARARAADAKSAAALARSHLEAAAARRNRAEQALADYDRRAAQLAAVTTDLRTHERAAEVLAEFRADRAASIRPDLEELASGFVQLLTDGRHEGMVLDDDMGARLLEGGLEIEVASGGAQDLVALSVRLAVSQLIAERAGHPVELILLDEPFGSLDAVRRGNVFSLIRRLSAVFSQVVVISHVEELQESVDHAIVLEFDESAGHTRVLEEIRREEAA